MSKDRIIIAVDFDGTCVTHDYPRVGKDIGAAKVLKRLRDEKNAWFILWTMRSGEELKDAVKWFFDNDITLYGVNKNPEQLDWTDSPKAYAHIYIDDAAIGAPLLTDPKISSRPFIDWECVEQILFEK